MSRTLLLISLGVVGAIGWSRPAQATGRFGPPIPFYSYKAATVCNEYCAPIGSTPTIPGGYFPSGYPAGVAGSYENGTAYSSGGSSCRMQCYKTRGYAYAYGGSERIQPGDLMFFDGAGEELPTTVVQRAVWGPSAKTHTAVCSVGNFGIDDSSACFKVVENTALGLPSMDCGGIEPNASRLMSLSPGVSENDVGVSSFGAGHFVKPLTSNDRLIILERISPTSRGSGYYYYNVSGFSQRYIKSQCSEFVNDALSLTIPEGSESVCLSSAAVSAIIPPLWDGIYEKANNSWGRESGLVHFWCWLGGNPRPPENIANQVVNAFLDRAWADTSASRHLTRPVGYVTGTPDMYNILAGIKTDLSQSYVCNVE